MTMRTKHEVIEDALKEYLRASKQLKKEILDRLEKVVGMERKSIIRRFGVLQRRKEGYDWNDHRGRPVYYTPDVVAALYEVWEISHELCAERLHPILGEYVNVLIRDRMWNHSDEATGKLRAMSLGQMKGFTQSFDKVISGGGRCMTKPSSLKEVIPVRRGPWRTLRLDSVRSTLWRTAAMPSRENSLGQCSTAIFHSSGASWRPKWEEAAKRLS